MQHSTGFKDGEPVVLQTSSLNEASTAPLLILKNYAKTVFNACAAAEGDITPNLNPMEKAKSALSPMEKAKFEAAEDMVRERKTTRYAYYQFKAKAEQPLLNSYRDILKNHSEAQSRDFDLSDQAIRKVANFIDKLPLQQVEDLKTHPTAYSDFVFEAYMISHVRVGRSKTQRIGAALDHALEPFQQELEPVVPDDTHPQNHIHFDQSDLHARIMENVKHGLDEDEIVDEIKSLARNMHAPLTELREVIEGMSAQDRKHDGIIERCFFLFKSFIGANSSNRKPLTAIGNMMSFMTAQFPQYVNSMIKDLKEAKLDIQEDRSDNYAEFLELHAPVLIKTYQFLLPSGYLIKGDADIDENSLTAFIADAEGEMKKIGVYNGGRNIARDVSEQRRSAYSFSPKKDDGGRAGHAYVTETALDL